MVVGWGCISRRGRDRGGEGGTHEQPLSDKLPLIRCGETYSTWQQQFKSKFLRSTTKSFALKRRNVTFYFIKLNAKVSPKSSGVG